MIITSLYHGGLSKADGNKYHKLANGTKVEITMRSGEICIGVIKREIEDTRYGFRPYNTVRITEAEAGGQMERYTKSKKGHEFAFAQLRTIE